MKIKTQLQIFKKNGKNHGTVNRNPGSRPFRMLTNVQNAGLITQDYRLNSYSISVANTQLKYYAAANKGHSIFYLAYGKLYNSVKEKDLKRTEEWKNRPIHI